MSSLQKIQHPVTYVFYVGHKFEPKPHTHVVGMQGITSSFNMSEIMIELYI